MFLVTRDGVHWAQARMSELYLRHRKNVSVTEIPSEACRTIQAAGGTAPSALELTRLKTRARLPHRDQPDTRLNQNPQDPIETAHWHLSESVPPRYLCESQSRPPVAQLA